MSTSTEYRGEASANLARQLGIVHERILVCPGAWTKSRSGRELFAKRELGAGAGSGSWEWFESVGFGKCFSSSQMQFISH